MDMSPKLAILFGILAFALADKQEEWEPAVAFKCGRPAMKRFVDGWEVDRTQPDCLDSPSEILAYCKRAYPDHNVTNVVEMGNEITIPNWPGHGDLLDHHTRPFRCLVGGFQSDALLVPQHCQFDHHHDQSMCERSAHWRLVATRACEEKAMHLETHGMLVSCGTATFRGVEFVCCPNQGHGPASEATKADSVWDDATPEVQEGGDWSSEDQSTEALDASLNEGGMDLYEAYLRRKPFPRKYYNEHKQFLAAKDQMRKNQQTKTTELLEQWQKAREHVEQVRQTDPARAKVLEKQIATRYEKLYKSYEDEDAADVKRINALHQQHVQAALNEKKRTTMDKYLKSLQHGDAEAIMHDLRKYIKAEEKDRMHTVNHYEHVKFVNITEAREIHPFVVNHLRMSEQRIDDALEMLKSHPDVEAQLRPEIEEFLRRFSEIANSIRDVVLPMPVEESSEESESVDNTDNQVEELVSEESNDGDFNIMDEDDSRVTSEEQQLDAEGDDVTEDEHDYERGQPQAAHAQMNDLRVQSQSLAPGPLGSSAWGSVLGVALGAAAVLVVLAASVFLVKRRGRAQHPNPGYVEVDPAASPEERHMAQMQMNGYENPTYKYFEVQSNPQA